MPPLLYEKYLNIIFKLNIIDDSKFINLDELFSVLCSIKEEALMVKLSECIKNIIFETGKIEGFEKFFLNLNDICLLDSLEVSKAMGNLFFTAWKIQCLNIEQIIEICENSKGFHYKWLLYSMVKYLEGSDSKSIIYCWDYYLNLNNRNSQFLWAHIVLPALINNDLGRDKKISIINKIKSKVKPT